ncbi:carboxymuconolactone decarboxylase family protein [Halioxenophilus aromaticivorans]|uniref:Carboxymuconolactone decarboxylase-like domain-containing protein n=1 Tax=Halioxenophilus aromaticivorans TaxID=1306992 RepID=A0AAV3U6R5_9ALTE
MRTFSLLATTAFTVLMGCSSITPKHHQQGHKMPYSDSDFNSIKRQFISQDIDTIDVLSNTQKHISRIAALATQQALPQLEQEIMTALNNGVAPTDIKETLYITAPFIGFPKTENSLATAYLAFKKAGVEWPVDQQERASDRYEKGLAIQFPIYGNAIKDAYADYPQPYNEKIPTLLTELLFGDIYSRSGTSLQNRELAVFIILASLGADRQLASHVRGNLKVGNSKQVLVGALVHCLPIIGFPAMFNALDDVKREEIAASP